MIVEPIKDVADWAVDDWRDAFNTLSELYSKALARAEAAEKRVAELEAQLAWRPVNELPEPGTRVDIIITDVEYTPGEGWFGDGFFGDSRARYEWRPLPPTATE